MKSLIEVRSDGTITLDQLYPHKDTSKVSQYTCTIKKDGTIRLKFYDTYGSELSNLPTKKKISCTKNLTNMVKSTTNACWQAAIEAYPISHQEPYNPNDEIVIAIDEQRELHYRKSICKLDIDILEAILLCHNKRKVRRAEITLKVISDELANRALLNDSSQANKLSKKSK